MGLDEDLVIKVFFVFWILASFDGWVLYWGLNFSVLVFIIKGFVRILGKLGLSLNGI